MCNLPVSMRSRWIYDLTGSICVRWICGLPGKQEQQVDVQSDRKYMQVR